MRKKSTRLLSAALAVCMMLSALPMGVVSAFADDGIDPTKGTPIENPEDGQTVIKIDTPGVYQMYKAYDMPILVTAEGDVTVNITADIDYKGSVGEGGNVYLNYVFRAANPEGMLTINAENHKVDAFENLRGFIYVHEGGKATINGGTYRSNDKETLFNYYGELWLNDVKAYSTVPVDNYGGKTYVDGGVYDGGDENGEYFWVPFLNKNGAELTLKSAKIHAEKGACIGNNANSTVKIENTTLEYDSTFAAISNDGNVYFYSGTISAPNASAIHNRKEEAYTEVSGGTIEKSKIGIEISAGKVVLGGGSFDGNKNDIYLRNDQHITIEDTFTDTATVKCEDAALNRRITTDTDSHYQKDLKLVSMDPDYIIDYKKNEDGIEYRCLSARETGKYYVNPIQATMAVGDTEVRPYTQFMPGTKVTLNAFSAEEGKKLTRWKVEKIAAPESEVMPNAGMIEYDPENPETATLTVPNYDVFVTAEYEDEIVDPGTGDDAAGNIQGAISAVVVGAAAGAIIYEAGTGIYRVINMPGIPMPSNRIELAELLWERADKPEPVSTALYDDIDEDDTDAQKAARWAVEQDLMKDDADNNKFNPYFPVSKLRVCLTWNAAKEKGLFDTDKPAE